MAIAVHMSSESGDSYFYIMDGQPTQEEFQAEAVRRLGDELAHIADYDTAATYKHNLEIVFPDADEDDEDDE